MRRILATLVLLAAVPAFADDFGDDAPAKSHTKCKSPPCHCKDATSSPGCVDKAACATFCEDHGGPVAFHKKHRRGGNAPTATNADE